MLINYKSSDLLKGLQLFQYGLPCQEYIPNEISPSV